MHQLVGAGTGLGRSSPSWHPCAFCGCNLFSECIPGKNCNLLGMMIDGNDDDGSGIGDYHAFKMPWFWFSMGANLAENLRFASEIGSLLVLA